MARSESAASRRTRAQAELTQAAMRYARSEDASDTESRAAERRYDEASDAAVSAGLSRDQVYRVAHDAMHRVRACGPNSACHGPR